MQYSTFQIYGKIIPFVLAITEASNSFATATPNSKPGIMVHLEISDGTFSTRSLAQLSQRDRTTLCVVEYFAKSLKITENGTIQKLGYSFLFAFMALSCIISENRRHIGRKSQFFIPPAVDTPLRGPVRILPYRLVRKY